MDVKNHGLAVRSRAIGMIQAGMTQKEVATELHVSLRSIERWWKADKLGKSQETKPRCGRPKLLNRVSKIIITKSLRKRGKSTREIARKLTNKGYFISHTAVHRYLRSDLGVKSFKRPKRHRLTDKMARKFDEVEPCVQVKFPAKIHV